MRQYIRSETRSNMLDPQWPVVVYADDREKQTFRLPSEWFTVERKRLVTADYTFAGLERVVAIERKNSLGEIVSDLSSTHRLRFVRFLCRLQKFPVRCILIESAGPDDACDMPDYRKFRNDTIINTVHYWLAEIELRYQIPILFLGNDTQLRQQLLSRVFQRACLIGRSYRR